MNNNNISIKRFFILLSLLFTFACSNQLERKDYFSSYFAAVVKDNPNSQRIFSIWFAGDRQAYTKEIYIGGSKSESQKWFSSVEDMLKGHAEVKNGEMPFLFEIVVDQVTYESEKNQLERLKKLYPKSFKVTFLSDIPKEKSPPKKIIDHAYVGNPAVASDALRIWYLANKDYATNVYIDVDNFLDKLENLDRYPDYKIFGREVQPGFVYFSQLGNDYLIDKGVEPLKLSIIQKNGIKRYDLSEHLLSHFKNRARFMELPLSKLFDNYRDDIERLVDYQMNHPEKTIDFVLTVIRALGPQLWVDSSRGDNPEAKKNEAMQDKMVSAQSWKDGRRIPFDTKGLSVNTFNTIKLFEIALPKVNNADQQELKRIILRLNLLGWDHNYFSKFANRELSYRLAAYIKNQWDEAKRILKDADISLSDDIEADLKSRTGGLYLSFEAIE